MYKIAILYICTGKYNVFWHGFYDSAEKYLFTDHQKTYFVFTDTDSKNEIFSTCNNTIVIFQEKLGWPFDTLMRFKMFYSQSDQLADYDYIYFFNANMRLIDFVGQDLLPDNGSKDLVGVLHPGYYLDSKLFYPYDRNRNSLAYIPFHKGKYYFMGGLNGGSAKEYLEMVKILKENIDFDLKNNIIAKWHDESHLNKYFLNKKISVKGPEYGFPEGSRINVNPKIIILNKKKWGGHTYLREDENINKFTENSNFVHNIKTLIEFKKMFLKIKKKFFNIFRNMLRLNKKFYKKLKNV